MPNQAALPLGFRAPQQPLWPPGSPEWAVSRGRGREVGGGHRRTGVQRTPMSECQGDLIRRVPTECAAFVYAPTMPGAAVVPFDVGESPATVLTVTGTDGVQYEVKIATLVMGAIDTGMKNPLDGMPIFNLQTQVLVQVKRKTDG